MAGESRVLSAPHGRSRCVDTTLGDGCPRRGVRKEVGDTIHEDVVHRSEDADGRALEATDRLRRLRNPDATA
jgi:hypothetical protein